MQTALARKLGCDVPIFAFSHCRDVVVAVTKAGGFGVLGASTFSPEHLEQELRWIDDHVGSRPYGVDIIIPTTYDREAEADADPERLIPREHRAFMENILAAEGVPELPEDDRARVRHEIVTGRGAMTPDGARKLLEVTLRHPLVTLVVSALGAPPADVVAELKGRGIMVGALCGKAAHARRQVAAGVEMLVAQGTEAGGHTGDISTLVLVPQVVEACPGVPVLAAGGISRGSQIAAALALGAEGVWTGTIWLGTRESELTPFEKQAVFAAGAEDAVRRRVRTGKTVRMIRSKLSEAWEKPGAPSYLPTPLQGILYNEMHARVVRAQRADLYSFPVGQSVVSVNEETSVREVMMRLQTEYLTAMERMVGLAEGA
jgi:NAD(P)H-dependent flavin oxidoreductase YrpB (nitropropane dioxygenase family)